MVKKLQSYFQVIQYSKTVSTALLLLRLVVGIAFIIHGWGKIQTPFGWMPPQAPVPGILQFLAAFSEFGGGIALVVGLLVPLAMLGLSCTMAVAVVMHVAVMNDPFVSTAPGGSSYELALMYLATSVLIFFVGPGRFSLDSKVFGRRG